MIHLDVFFISGFCVQTLILWPEGNEFMLTGAFGILLIIPALVLVVAAVQKESTRLAIAATVFVTAEASSLASGIYLFSSTVYSDWGIRSLCYGVAATSLLLATAVVAAVCWRNFDRRLKSHLQRASLPEAEVRRHLVAEDDRSEEAQECSMPYKRMQLD